MSTAVMPPAVRRALAAVLSVDVRIERASAETLAGRTEVSARFDALRTWSTLDHRPLETVPKFPWRDLGTAASAARAAIRSPAPPPGWVLRSNDLGPGDPEPRGSRAYRCNEDAWSGGYSACFAGAPVFLSGFESDGTFEGTAAAVDGAVRRAADHALAAAFVARVAPAWRPEWARGFRAAARVISLGAARRARCPL